MKEYSKTVFYCPVMRLLLRRVWDGTSDPSSTDNRTRLGLLAGWVSTVLSLFLCAVKGWLGLLSGSVSLIADATNNLTDAGSSLMIALGFHWSRKPRDERHPFGHGRIEAVATLVLAIALILVGVEVGKSGVLRLVSPKPIESPSWLMGVIAVTVVVKLWMAVFARQLARMTRSTVLKADAWNHTFDVLCTLMVVVALVAARMGWPAVDGWTALGLSLFILYTGIQYAREAVDILLGEQPDPEEVAAVRRAASEVSGVLGVHEIMLHQYGDVKMVSLHIEVESSLTVSAAHEIAEVAEQTVECELGWRAVVHVDPVDRSHPLFDEVNRELRRFVEEDAELVDFHDLRLEGNSEPYSCAFDLVTGMDVNEQNYEGINHRTRMLMEQKFGGRVESLQIGLEAVVDSTPMKRARFELNGTSEN